MKIEQNLHSRARPTSISLTFGDFVAGCYDAFGKRRAKRIVRLSVARHLIEFRGAERIVIS